MYQACFPLLSPFCGEYNCVPPDSIEAVFAIPAVRKRCRIGFHHEFVNSDACLFSGAVTSKEAAEQFVAAAHTFRDLEIEDKLGHLVAGKDVTGHKTGLFKRLAVSFQMEIVSQGTCTSIIVHFKMPVWERSARQSKCFAVSVPCSLLSQQAMETVETNSATLPHGRNCEHCLNSFLSEFGLYYYLPEMHGRSKGGFAPPNVLRDGLIVLIGSLRHKTTLLSIFIENCIIKYPKRSA